MPEGKLQLLDFSRDYEYRRDQQDDEKNRRQCRFFHFATPGPQTTHSFEREIVAEICTLFPELDPETGTGYSPAARRMLRAYEAQVLTAAARAA